MQGSIPNAFAQTEENTSKINSSKAALLEFIRTDSGLILKRKLINPCKYFLYESSFIAEYINTLPIISIKLPIIIKQPTLIMVHGNIEYDFFYRSKTDNPFYQNDLQQHTEKVNLDIILKEKIPLKVSFSLRQSNSPYFKNFTDINFQFDPYSYRKNLKQHLIEKISKTLSNTKNINSIELIIADKVSQLSNLKDWIQSPATLQKIIEERELQNRLQKNVPSPSLPFILPNEKKYSKNNLKNQLPISSKVDLKADTTKNFFTLYFNKKEKQIDSLLKSLEILNKHRDSLKNAAQKNIAVITQQIYKAGDTKELGNIATKNGIDLNKEDRLSKGLGAIRNLSIGRSVLNYTELTAKDITISGLNIEYNPSYYLAFAVGKINYQFRDFYNRNLKTGNQYLLLGRIGTGNPNKRSLILTVFKGRKSTTENIVNNNENASTGIIGYSLESTFKKDENNKISFEVAKSTKPSLDNQLTNKQIEKLWAFSDHSNLGINIKATTIIAVTKTNLSAFYRKTGQSFQSFSLFSFNTDQTAWLARIDQDLFKRKISLTGMLRRNDFTNPFTQKTYKTTTVFKSFILNVRLPKYPTLSIGYFPGTQLFVIDKETIRENAYYLFNSTISYNYFFKKIQMNSLMVYNRYFNKATEAGFIPFKGITYYGMQSFFIEKIQLQTGFAFNSQPGLTYTTTECSIDYSFKQSLKLGVTTKYNKVEGGMGCWGERAQLMVDILGVGRLQFQYEKSYLPDTSHSLLPFEMGRLSWYKYF